MTQEKWESEKGGLCCFSGEDYHDTCGSCYPTAIAPGVVVWREGPLKLSECRGTSYRLAVVFWVLPPLLILIAHIYGCRSHSSANLTCSYFFYFPFNVEQLQKKHMWVGCCVQWLSLPMSSEFLFWPLMCHAWWYQIYRWGWDNPLRRARNFCKTQKSFLDSTLLFKGLCICSVFSHRFGGQILNPTWWFVLQMLSNHNFPADSPGLVPQPWYRTRHPSRVLAPRELKPNS